MTEAVTPIRIATLDDITLIGEIARQQYPHLDVEKARGWLTWAIQHPDRLVLVGLNSVGIAQVAWFYGMEKRARLDVLARRPAPEGVLEAFRMVRIMVSWGKEKGATGNFKLDADTGVDFGPFAKRLGGKPVTVTRYEIPL